MSENKLSVSWSKITGKLMQNGFVERLNGNIKRERLNANVFRTIPGVREMVQQWSYDYNYHRPHATLGQKTPAEVALVLEDKISNFECSKK